MSGSGEPLMETLASCESGKAEVSPIETSGSPSAQNDVAAEETTSVEGRMATSQIHCCKCWLYLMSAIREEKLWWTILVVSLVLAAVIVAQMTRDLDVFFPSLAEDQDLLYLWTIPFLFVYASLLMAVTVTYVLRLCALGLGFFRQIVNYFDVCILIMENIVNIVVWSVSSMDDSMIGIFLPYLLIRYVLKVQPLRVVILALLSSFKTISWTVVTLLLVIFAFCQISFFFFSEKVLYFDSTLDSMMTMVQVMSGDAWASDVTKKTAEHYPKALVYFYFMLYYLIVSIIVLNVVTAVFMDAIKSKSEELAASKATKEVHGGPAAHRTSETELVSSMQNPVNNHDASQPDVDGIAAVLHELQKINRRLDALESKFASR